MQLDPNRGDTNLVCRVRRADSGVLIHLECHCQDSAQQVCYIMLCFAGPLTLQTEKITSPEQRNPSKAQKHNECHKSTPAALALV